MKQRNDGAAEPCGPQPNVEVFKRDGHIRSSFVDRPRVSSELTPRTRPHSIAECKEPNQWNLLGARTKEQGAEIKSSLPSFLGRSSKESEAAKNRLSLAALNALDCQEPRASSNQEKKTPSSKEYAAMAIQACYRGYSARRRFKLAVKRGHEVIELVRTEGAYVATLQDLVKRYKGPLGIIARRETFRQLAVTEDDVAGVFGNIEVILGHHEELLEQLRTATACYSVYTCVGSLLSGLGSKHVVDMYTTYIQAESVRTATIKRLMANPDFCSWLRKVERSRGRNVSFTTLLGNVFQRVMRYQMILQGMEKHTPWSHPDYQPTREALATAQLLAAKVNSNIDKAKKTEELLASVRGTMQGVTKDELCEHHGDVWELRNGKPKERHLVLLTSHIVCLEKQRRRRQKQPGPPSTPSKGGGESHAANPKMGRQAPLPPKAAPYEKQAIPCGSVRWCARLSEVVVSQPSAISSCTEGKVADRTLILTVPDGTRAFVQRIVVFETDDLSRTWADAIHTAKQSPPQQSGGHSPACERPSPQAKPRNQALAAKNNLRPPLRSFASATGGDLKAPPQSPLLAAPPRHRTVIGSALLGGSMDSVYLPPPSPLATPQPSCREPDGEPDVQPDVAQQLEGLEFTRHKKRRELEGLQAMQQLYKAQAQRDGRELRATETKALAGLAAQMTDVGDVLTIIDNEIMMIKSQVKASAAPQACSSSSSEHR